MLRCEWLRYKGAERQEGFEAGRYEMVFSVAGERTGKRFNWKGEAMCGRMLSSVLVVGALARVVCAAGPSASELLKEFGETQDKLTASFISKAESTATWTARIPVRPEIKPGVRYELCQKTELRSDGGRCYVLIKKWGNSPGRPPRSEDEANYVIMLWNGVHRYQYVYATKLSPASKRVHGYLVLKDKDHVDVDPMRNVNHSDGGPVRGFFYGGWGDDRIDAELKKAGRLRVERTMENVGGSECYVINARANRCDYRIWLDPEHDYNIARAVVKRPWVSAHPPEYYRGRKVTGAIKGRSKSVVENVRFRKIDGIWVPVECDYYLDNKAVRSYEYCHYHYRVTDYQLNPDHEALGSFKNDFVRNGARVYGVGDVKYTWRDGKVVDANSTVIVDTSKPGKATVWSISDANNPSAEELPDEER